MTEQKQSPRESGSAADALLIGDRPLAGRHTGDGRTLARPLLFVALLGLLLGGFALMGAAFATDNGIVFCAGLLLSGTAFLVPLATAHHER